jgi:hypothetical protein
MILQCRRMPSFFAIADSLLAPGPLELGLTFICGVRILFESFSRMNILAPSGAFIAGVVINGGFRDAVYTTLDSCHNESRMNEVRAFLTS